MADTLTPITEDIFEAREWLKMMPGFYFDIRMTVLRLPGGRLLLHSPLSFNDDLKAAVDALGEVGYIVAPNTFHHLYAGHWKQAYPEAKLVGPRGLSKKRPDLTLDVDLRAGAPDEWAGVLGVHVLEGSPAVQEIILHHPSSGTLLATDLLFNMQETKGAVTGLVMAMMGCSHPPAQSRALKFVTKDKAAAAQSIQDLLKLDFDRLIIAHGEVIETGGKEAVASAFAWLLSDS